jgi:hypothetical protein
MTKQQEQLLKRHWIEGKEVNSNDPNAPDSMIPVFQDCILRYYNLLCDGRMFKETEIVKLCSLKFNCSNQFVKKIAGLP